MTIPQLIVSYAVCWWMVLFMVLPSGVEPEEKPGLGHAPSAPKDPQLKRKFKRTTLLAILPTIVIYLVATTARAEEGIYHVGGGCKTLAAHQPAEDVSVRDGEGLGGKKVVPANLESSTAFDSMKSVQIPLNIPTESYLKNDKINADMSESFAKMGELEVGMDGKTTLNGKALTQQESLNPDCTPHKEKP